MLSPFSPFGALRRRAFHASAAPGLTFPAGLPMAAYYEDSYGVESASGVAASVGDGVARWLDQSGNDRHLIQERPTARFTKTASGLYTNPGDVSALDKPWLYYNDAIPTVVEIWAVVNRADTPISLATVISNGYQGPYNRNIRRSNAQIDRYIVGNENDFSYGGGLFHVNGADTLIMPATDHVIRVKPVYPLMGDSIDGLQNVWVGRSLSNDPRPWTGYFRAIYLTFSALTTSQEARFYSYIAAKYNITLG